MKLHSYYVYILTNQKHKLLYTGVTNDLVRRCNEHRKKIIPGFTAKYNIGKLVYFELYDFIDLAIKREKEIKGYSRAKKERLINSFNLQWIDLFANGKIIDPSSKKINNSQVTFQKH